MMVDGWAIRRGDGLLLIRTVSDTRRAAIVNWLCTEVGAMATRHATDDQIEVAWNMVRGSSDAVRVSVSATPENYEGA